MILYRNASVKIINEKNQPCQISEQFTLKYSLKFIIAHLITISQLHEHVVHFLLTWTYQIVFVNW